MRDTLDSESLIDDIAVVAQFGETLRRLRKKRGLTQAELASKAGVSRGYLIRLEQGKQDPTLSMLRRLAKELRIPVSRLVR